MRLGRIAFPDAISAAQLRLQGRMQRIVFWPILLTNFALLSAVTYGLAYSPWPTLVPLWRSFEALFYAPACLAAVLRLHDRNQAGSLALAVFLLNALAPLAELFLSENQITVMNIGINLCTFYLLFQCGQPGDVDANHYGLPPGLDFATEMSPAPPDPPAPDPIPAPAIRTATARPAAKSFGRRAG